MTATFCEYTAVPEQSAVAYRAKLAVPDSAPPAGAEMVVESCGVHDWAVVSVGWSWFTVEASPASLHAPETPSVFGKSPLYEAIHR